MTTETKQTHTPLPERLELVELEGPYWAFKADGEIKLYTDRLFCAEIVRRYNSHEALVRALEQVVRECNLDQWPEACKAVHDALAKAAPAETGKE